MRALSLALLLFTPCDTAIDALRSHAREGSPVELLPMGVAQRLIVASRDGVLPPASAQAYIDRARGR